MLSYEISLRLGAYKFSSNQPGPLGAWHSSQFGLRRPNLPSAQRSRGKNPTWYLMHIPECVHGVLGGTSAGPIGYSIGDSLGLSIGTPID